MELGTQRTKEELERLMQAINSSKSTLEKIKAEIISEDCKLSDTKNKKKEIDEYIESVKGDIFVYTSERDSIKLKLDEERIKLDSITKDRFKAEMDTFALSENIKKEKEKLEEARRSAFNEIEEARKERDEINESAKKRLIKEAEDIKPLEEKRREIRQEIDKYEKHLLDVTGRSDAMNMLIPELESKVVEIETQIKNKIKNSESEMKRCSDIGFEKERLEKELAELDITLKGKKKEIEEAQEQLLRVVDREKRVDETAKRVKALYKRAGIDVTI